MKELLFNRGLSAFLLLVFWPVILVSSVWCLVNDGRPAIFLSKRVGVNGSSFWLYKTRTMYSGNDDGKMTSSLKSSGILPGGTFVRKYRIDELPQLWNIFVGSMSFVGPRPPLERYVAKAPRLYEAVLRMKPGVTGLSSILMSKYEARVLGGLNLDDDAEDIYLRRCIGKKYKLDMIHQAHNSIRFDALIMVVTVLSMLDRKYLKLLHSRNSLLGWSVFKMQKPTRS